MPPAAPTVTTHNYRLNRNDWIFIVLIILYVLYALLFIKSTSVRIGSQEYFCLFDDSMISMTYAKNLAGGYGLVYNVGEDPVEGYSNLLWVLFMAAVLLLKPSSAYGSLVIQVSELILIVASLYYIRKTIRRFYRSEVIALAAVFLTAFYFPINNWALQGMDVGPVMFVLSLALYFTLACIDNGRVTVLPFIVLGIGTLLRIDFVVFFFVMALFLFSSLKSHRKTVVFYSLATILLFLGGQTLFRLLYYGEWLPNTYFLKMTGTPLIVRGLMGLTSTIGLMDDLSYVIFCLPLIYIMFHKADRFIQLASLLIFTVLFYNIYVGGDAWDWYGGANRYWAVVMPFFFFLVAASVRGLFEWFQSILSKWGLKQSGVMNVIYYATILAIFLIIHSAPSRGHLKELVLQEPVLHYDEHVYSLAMSCFLKDVVTSDASIAGTEAGAVKYFTGNRFIDFLGKTDRHIAKEVPRWGTKTLDYYRYRPGHNKCDGPYSIKVLQPDVILRLWCDQDELQGYLMDNYINIGLVRRGEVYIKKNSPHIRWDITKFSDKNLIGRYFNPPKIDLSLYSIGAKGL